MMLPVRCHSASRVRGAALRMSAFELGETLFDLPKSNSSALDCPPKLRH